MEILDRPDDHIISLTKAEISILTGSVFDRVRKLRAINIDQMCPYDKERVVEELTVAEKTLSILGPLYGVSSEYMSYLLTYDEFQWKFDPVRYYE